VLLTGLAGLPALLVSSVLFFAAYGAVLLMLKEELAVFIVYGTLAEKLGKFIHR
jgi:hypothetical protein